MGYVVLSTRVTKKSFLRETPTTHIPMSPLWPLLVGLSISASLLIVSCIDDNGTSSAQSGNHNSTHVTLTEGDRYSVPSEYARCTGDEVIELRLLTEEEEKEEEEIVSVASSSSRDSGIAIVRLAESEGNFSEVGNRTLTRYNTTSSKGIITVLATRFGYAQITCYTVDNTSGVINFKVINR